MAQNQTCKLLCVSDPIPKDDVEFINQAIEDDYALNWVVDGLPAAHENRDEHTDELYYNIGFNLGFMDNGRAALNNHYEIYIYYHDRPDGKYRVVGVIVYPASKDFKVENGKPVCDTKAYSFHLSEKGGDKVVYTYSVNWVVRMIPHSLSLSPKESWKSHPLNVRHTAFLHGLGHALG